MLIDMSTKERFDDLYAEYKRTRRIWCSNSDQINAVPSFYAILTMGPDVLPFVAEVLERERDWIFCLSLLNVLSGSGPKISEDIAGYMDKVTDVYLKWCRDMGWLKS